MNLGPRNIKAKLTKACNIYEVPTIVGAVVDLDATTFANLEKKGWVELATDKPEKKKGE
jgi:hypothetical protein